MIPFWYQPIMELRHLRYFAVVAEELNVRRAARRLHVSQPPLSRQIRDLEAELGTRLFDRTNKRLALTPAGECFLKETRPILAHPPRRGHLPPAARRGESGPVCVALPVTIGRRFHAAVAS